MIFRIFTAADLSVGRVNKDLLSTQTLAELLVENLKGKTVFQNNGEFDEIENWDGINLSGDGDVDCIYFEGIDIVEFFGCTHGDECCPMEGGGSIDFNWIPTSVKVFYILFLQISGTLQTSGLPRGLVRFDITGNHFDSALHTEGLPRGLQYLHAGGNRLSGSLDLTKLPEELLDFNASNNKFTGSLDFSCLPSTLQDIQLSKNLFCGTINIGRLPKSLKSLQIQWNAIEQAELVVDNNLPNIGSLKLDGAKFQRVVDQSGKELPTDAVDNERGIYTF